MEVAQFYLHLPSNSSLDKFPNNTLTEQHVSLPQTVSLTGDWEVALTEIHYPHSWNNVQRNFVKFKISNHKLMSEHGRYQIDHLPRENRKLWLGKLCLDISTEDRNSTKTGLTSHLLQ